MDFATTKRQVMRELREWVRLCAIEKLRVNSKTARWKRWQHHPAKTYRKVAEDWRKWGVRFARASARTHLSCRVSDGALIRADFHSESEHQTDQLRTSQTSSSSS